MFAIVVSLILFLHFMQDLNLEMFGYQKLTDVRDHDDQNLLKADQLPDYIPAITYLCQGLLSIY
jgi:hypothetical protein